jgi:hypothetical protein
MTPSSLRSWLDSQDFLSFLSSYWSSDKPEIELAALKAAILEHAESPDARIYEALRVALGECSGLNPPKMTMPETHRPPTPRHRVVDGEHGEEGMSHTTQNAY